MKSLKGALLSALLVLTLAGTAALAKGPKPTPTPSPTPTPTQTPICQPIGTVDQTPNGTWNINYDAAEILEDNGTTGEFSPNTSQFYNDPDEPPPTNTIWFSTLDVAKQLLVDSSNSFDGVYSNPQNCYADLNASGGCNPPGTISLAQGCEINAWNYFGWLKYNSIVHGTVCGPAAFVYDKTCLSGGCVVQSSVFTTTAAPCGVTPVPTPTP